MPGLSITQINALQKRLGAAYNEGFRDATRRIATLMKQDRRGTIVLDRTTCDWIIDEQDDTAICRTHGEVCDGVNSKHFPGNTSREDTAVLLTNHHAGWWKKHPHQ